jgi:hypothetical protein
MTFSCLAADAEQYAPQQIHKSEFPSSLYGHVDHIYFLGFLIKSASNSGLLKSNDSACIIGYAFNRPLDITRHVYHFHYLISPVNEIRQTTDTKLPHLLVRKSIISVPQHTH